MNDTVTTVRSVLRERSRELLGCANVVATGVGYKMVDGKLTDTPSIICSVVNKVAASSLSSRDLIPAEIGGVPTDVVATGIIRAFQAPTDRFRPAPGGVSVGHKDITAGTLGCWVRRNGEWMILSNNHVLANINAAKIGDAILQPGSYDGGKNPDDQIATLEDFVTITLQELPSDCDIAGNIVALLNALSGVVGSDTRLKAVRIRAIENIVDAAIARPLRQEDVNPEILNIGAIERTATAVLGMPLKKSGRTTGYTEGQVTQVDVTANVGYGDNRTALFTDQIMAGAMSQPGDSGSAVLNNNSELVGLLFAGSDTTTIINRIENVFSALNLTL
ncbi:MAG: S1 family peptidase [Methylococcaceae bacterium]|nr:S1 family peptidase [Methylococcaceae bacterium]